MNRITRDVVERPLSAREVAEAAQREAWAEIAQVMTTMGARREAPSLDMLDAMRGALAEYLTAARMLEGQGRR